METQQIQAIIKFTYNFDENFKNLDSRELIDFMKIPQLEEII